MESAKFDVPPRVDAQARLAAIVESSDDAIVSKTLEGIVTSWNGGAQRIFGWTADEVIGKSITIIIPQDRLQEEPRILERMRRGERIDHFETVRQTKDGRLLDVSVTISPVRDAGGRIVGVSKIARDITPQKQLERELRYARDAAETANRAKDHFLSILSHELRTPLTPVLAVLSLLEESPTLSIDELRAQISMIRRNVETEARLVDDLLDLTRIARGKVQLHFEVIDAHTVVRDAVATFQSEIDAKGIAVTFTLRAKQHHIWADAGRFQQIILNLLSNAVKFTPQDGAIHVTSRNANSHIVIEVIDDGIGIAPDMLPRLFNAFEQGEQTITRQFGGLGLGLSIVRSLMEMHGGRITAASEGTGHGAKMSIEMGTIAPSDPKGAPSSSTNVTGACHVLLVEDHNDTRRVLSKLLASFGCSVTATASVKEALKVAETEKFDLLVSDIGLPDGSGVEVMRHMRERYNVRGIALSGFGQDEDVQRSREAGFETHLTKPINLQTLKDVIRKVAG